MTEAAPTPHNPPAPTPAPEASMSLSMTADARARLSTLPPGVSLPPDATPLLLRRTFRPKGPTGEPTGRSYTLSLFDTGAPHPDGGTWLGFRLHMHAPEHGRRGRLLFAGSDLAPEVDVNDAARACLERLTVRPGDVSPDPTAGYNPDQLGFSVVDALPLRAAVRARLGWRDAVPFNPRLDLEQLASYTSKSLETGGRRHRVRVGVVTAEGETRRAAVEALSVALGNHLSAEPEFLCGEHTGTVYALLPHGARWRIVQIRPWAKPEARVSAPLEFPAQDVAEARTVFLGTVEKREAAAPAKRPAARAGARQGASVPASASASA